MQYMKHVLVILQLLISLPALNDASASTDTPFPADVDCRGLKLHLFKLVTVEAGSCSSRCEFERGLLHLSMTSVIREPCFAGTPPKICIRLISRDLAGGDARSPMQKPPKTIQWKFDEGPSLQVGDLAGCLAHDAKRYMAAGLLDFVECLYGLHRVLCSKLRKAFEEGQLSAVHVQQCACEITIKIAAVYKTPQASRSCSNEEVAERFRLERGWQDTRGPLPDYGNNLAVMVPGGREHVNCDESGEVDCSCGSEYPAVCSYNYLDPSRLPSGWESEFPGFF